MDKQTVKKELTELFEKADYKAYTILRHVSQSGMFRLISVFVVVENRPIVVDNLINVTGVGIMDKKREGIRCSGCGMDMGFDLVYSLSMFLFGDGYKVKQEWL